MVYIFLYIYQNFLAPRKAAIPSYMKMVKSKEVLNEQKQQIYENIQKINNT